MADLSFTEKRTVEQCFGMGSGYVLDFSDRTFNEFIQDAVARNIDNGNYSSRGTSKANRLRAFFQAEPNHVVGTGRVPREKVYELAHRLQLDEWEKNRTHWAIKDGDVSPKQFAEMLLQKLGRA